jgi:hypothetical protein
MTMDQRASPEADHVAQVRALLETAAKGVERLESAATLAFCRLAALKGLQARLEELAGSGLPDAAEAAAIDAATVCREAKALIRSVRARRQAAAIDRAVPRAAVGSRRGYARRDAEGEPGKVDPTGEEGGMPQTSATEPPGLRCRLCGGCRFRKRNTRPLPGECVRCYWVCLGCGRVRTTVEVTPDRVRHAGTVPARPR